MDGIRDHVRAFDDLIYEDCYNNVDDDEYDSEDSNQENYFGNEYPDEDDDAALNSDRDDDLDDDDDEDEDTKHLRKGLEKFVFEDDDEENEDDGDGTSSEDGGFYNTYRDPYVHSVDPEEEGFCADVDSCDVDRYGLAYARYKARILNKSKSKMGSDVDDDSSTEGGADHFYNTDMEDDYYHSANESDN